jgi:hypothetical protein
MYSNNDVEGKKNNYDQKLLYKGHFNGNNEVIKYEPYNYGIYTHKSSFKRFIGNLLGKVWYYKLMPRKLFFIDVGN